MRRFEHGGDIYTHGDVIDFSANLNPLGMPQGVRENLRENIERFEAYPDQQCSRLKRALAHTHGVDKTQIVCTAGATDLIDRVVRVMAPCTALLAAPCYLGYEQALVQHGVQVRHHFLNEHEDFVLTPKFLQSIDGEIALVIIASPNNPTGLPVDPDVLQAIIKRAADVGARVLLDESFIEFSTAPSMMSHIQDHPHLIIARSFTKVYAMAGLRLGFGVCADSDFIRLLHERGQPWAVSTPAQLAGCAALERQEFVEESRSYVRHTRAELESTLRSLGLRCIKSDANYIMFKCERALHEPLLERGFLIRRCENYVGLDDTWYRIAVRTNEENARLAAAIEELLS